MAPMLIIYVDHKWEDTREASESNCVFGNPLGNDTRRDRPRLPLTSTAGNKSD